MKHYVSFKGRAPRSEFWKVMLANFVVNALASVAINGLFREGEASVSPGVSLLVGAS